MKTTFGSAYDLWISSSRMTLFSPREADENRRADGAHLDM
jgi:hypothetical protein